MTARISQTSVFTRQKCAGVLGTVSFSVQTACRNYTDFVQLHLVLTQFDTASASQVGLPRIIKETQCDTAEPRNLLDNDFDDTSTVLPPARPQNEHTLVQFLVYKSRVVSVYGMICDFTTSSKQRDYEEAMRLDVLLNTAYAQKPPILELKSMQRSVLDGAELITRRIYMAMSYHHAQITLHRKFMILAKANSKYSISHTTCVNAATEMLQLQAELFEQCQPGRMLYTDRWKILSLVQSEFLLATTVLCFNLDDDIKKGLIGGKVAMKSVEALERSRSVWEPQKVFSKEAQTALNTIDVVLGRLHSRSENNGADNAQPSEASVGFTSSVLADMSYGDGQSFDPPADQDRSQTEAFQSMQGSSVSTAFDAFFEMEQEWEGWLQL